jgi:predicted transposase YbfD/YdcC
MLVCVGLAKLSGVQGAADIWRWMDNRRRVLSAAGLPVFSYKTVLRLIRGGDAGMVDKVLCGLVARLAVARAVQTGVMVVAVDGKELTGSISRDGPAVRLVSVWDHATGVVLAQTQVGDKGGEQAALPRLLAQVNTALRAATGWAGDLIVTLDANFVGSPALSAVAQAGAYWLVTVKGNRRKARDSLAAASWVDKPSDVTIVDTGHGRRAVIKVKWCAGSCWETLPIEGMRSTLRIHRVTDRPNPAGGKSKKSKKSNKPVTPSARTTRRGGLYKQTHETVYVATSYEADKNPSQNPGDVLYRHARGHWGIESKSHWVRDVDFSEDASQIRTRAAPRFIAAFNNFAISLIRLAEGINANIRAATQKAAASIAYTISLLSPLLE